MREGPDLDRCAAYIAARAALLAVQGVIRDWPPDLAALTHHAAADVVRVTAAAITQIPGSAGRRRCLRDALVSAISVAALVEDAEALGLGPEQLDAVQRITGRAIAVLGTFLHANGPAAGEGYGDANVSSAPPVSTARRPFEPAHGPAVEEAAAAPSRYASLHANEALVSRAKPPPAGARSPRSNFHRSPAAPGMTPLLKHDCR